MSAEQMMNFRRFKQLLSDLKAYGLNPREWRVDRTLNEEDQLLIRHRLDEEFRLRGLILREPTGRIQVSGLTVVSL